MKLNEFLAERLHEDEEAVRNWWQMRSDAPGGYKTESWGGLTRHYTEDGREIDEADLHEHYIERAEPDKRKLADIRAKRKIAALHTPPTILYGSGPVDCNSCLDTWGNGYCPTLRTLALPYAEHPDYDPSWAPEGE